MSYKPRLSLGLFFSDTDEILFETPVSTCLWFESANFVKIFFEWKHEIIYIFSYKYL